MKQFWDIAALGAAHTGEGPLIGPVEARLRELSPSDRAAFHAWAAEVDQRLRTRTHHEVAALCFGTRSTRDFDLLRTWWIMQGERVVDTLVATPQSAAEMPEAEMRADVGETLTRAVAAVAASAGQRLEPANEGPWPAVTTPLVKLASRHRRAANALEGSQGPLWSAADLLRHTGRPVDSLEDLIRAFRHVADGGEAVVIGDWGAIDSQIRPSRDAVDRQGNKVRIPASLFVYFRPSRTFARALAGARVSIDVRQPEAELFAAMVDLGEPQVRVEVPHCVLLRVYPTPGDDIACLVRTRPSPQLFERANRTAVATDPGAGRRLFAPTPMGAQPRRTDEEDDRGVIGKVLNLFGL